MNVLFFIIPVIVFFIGVLTGYQVSRKERREHNKMVWDRFERRNIMRTINALVSAIDFKDHLTKNHSDNVKYYASNIAKEMGLSQVEIDRIKEACQVHDLGKIGVHDNILTKPGKLTPEEYKEMKLHALAGAVILKPFHFMDKVVQIVRQHHEHYNGEGYPDGLIGDKICIGARIMAVADSFEAMTSRRPYREPMSTDDAIAELKKFSGTQFDPKVVEAFLNVLEKNPDFLKKEEPPYEH